MSELPYREANRRELEARVLAAALKQSFERGDAGGAMLAHRALAELLKQGAQSEHGEPAAGQFAPEATEAQAPPPAAPLLAPEPAQAATDRAADEAGSGTEDVNLTAPRVGAEAVEPTPKEERQPGQAVARDNERAAPAAFPSEEEAPAVAAATDLSMPAAAPCPQVPYPGESSTVTFAAAEPAAAVQQAAAPAGYYDILSLDRLASFEEIHVRFLRLVKRLLRGHLILKEISAREFRDQLRTLCVAHDVLKDPVTRTDYDFRQMGLRGEGGTGIETPDQVTAATMPARTHLRIGELLQCSAILEPTELEIAVDMHKAMPEMPFGQFLLKQGFLSAKELDSALLGQKLIASGKITVAQFQIAMGTVREDSVHLSETLVQRGWIGAQELSPFTQEAVQAAAEPADTGPRVTEVPLKPVEPAALRKISMSNAVPDWADQIVWGGEGEKVEAANDAQSVEEVPEPGPLSTPQAVESPVEPSAGLQADELVAGAPEAAQGSGELTYVPAKESEPPELPLTAQEEGGAVQAPASAGADELHASEEEAAPPAAGFKADPAQEGKEPEQLPSAKQEESVAELLEGAAAERKAGAEASPDATSPSAPSMVSDDRAREPVPAEVAREPSEALYRRDPAVIWLQEQLYRLMKRPSQDAAASEEPSSGQEGHWQPIVGSMEEEASDPGEIVAGAAAAADDNRLDLSVEAEPAATDSDEDNT